MYFYVVTLVDSYSTWSSKKVPAPLFLLPWNAAKAHFLFIDAISPCFATMFINYIRYFSLFWWYLEMV